MLGCCPVELPRPQHSAGKLRFVRRVGIVLRFKAKAVVLLKAAGAWPPIEKIAAIKLHARLGRIDLHQAAAGWIFDASGQFKLALLPAKDKAMVVAFRLVRVFFELADALANRVRRSEIKRC